MAESPLRKQASGADFNRQRRATRSSSISPMHSAAIQNSIETSRSETSGESSPKYVGTLNAIDELKQHIRQRTQSICDGTLEQLANATVQSKLKRRPSVTVKRNDLERSSFESEIQSRLLTEESSSDDSDHDAHSHQSHATRSSGIITEEVHIVLRKSPDLRNEYDLELLERVFAEQKSLLRYNPYIRSKILGCVTHKRFQTGQIIFKEGDPSECFYFVVQGSFGMLRPQTMLQSSGPLANLPNASAIEARLERQRSPDRLDGNRGFRSNQKDVASDEFMQFFGADDCFGEIGLIKNASRGATVVCLETADTLVLEKSDYESVMKLWQEKEVEERVAFLHSIPIFQSWSRSSLTSLNSVLVHQTVLPSRVIVRENDDPEGMFFILSGECTVMKQLRLTETTKHVEESVDSAGQSSKVVASSKANASASQAISKGNKVEDKKLLHVGILVAGDYFGEVALLKSTKRTATVMSTSIVELLFLPKNEFSRRITHGPLDLLREQSEKYPSADELLKAYRTQKKWGEYKQKIVSSIVSTKESSKN